MGKWIGIVGESFGNEDGSSRQEEIARCEIGESVELRLDPENRFDPNCVRVVSRRDVQVGVLSKEHAAIVAAHMRAGHSIDAEIVKINGGTKSKPSRGLVIEADVDEDDFDRALGHVREHGLAGQRFHTPPTRNEAADGTNVKVWAFAAIALVVVLIVLL